MSNTARNLRWLGLAAVVIGYAVLANYTNQSNQAGALGALLALAPIALALMAFAWRSAQRPVMLGLLALAGIMVGLLWHALEQHYAWIYWLEHESVQWLLFITFARTLVAKRQPLCSQFAEIMHGELTRQHARYTYRVTVAWTLFFAAMITISGYLFFMQPVAIWSIFANFVFLPLVVLMFIVEYGIRRLVLPELEQADVMAAVRAYFQHSAARH